MRKTEQLEINGLVMREFEQAFTEIKTCNEVNARRLRSCSASVFETDNYYILQSYNTLIACIDKNTDTLYDALRYVYGYTSTSAQHISKFNHDYCLGNWGCANRYTYREV